MSKQTPRIVNVAEFRQETDRLFRVANVDYHACVNAQEVRNWLVVAGRALEECAALQTKRAKAYDLDQFKDAVRALECRVSQSGERIRYLEATA
ncbi:hypothetical protein [Trueperella pecoris]|uniref:Uncharacterized protein n=1 Tax=Trueperella pecoris TaxID=2733571 RepID=A0A7M1QUT1_9ACTO|nr:hypothetical protein [Trueperella pecoris]QOR45274.1 hypothetical protein INS88_08335 [Trueperella pecoris]